MLCCFELSCISFNEYYPMKFQFLKVILVLFEFYLYIMLCHMHIINLYAKYIWIFQFGRILRSVLRSPDSRSNYPNPILRRISSLTTLSEIVPYPEVAPVSEVIADSPPTLSPSPDPILQPESDLPIVIQKDIRHTRNHSPHYINLCCHRLSPLHYTCLSSVSIPKTQGEALSRQEWRQTMIDEMYALQSSDT